MTYTATVTSKRQVTIPIKLFEELGLKKGDTLIFEKDDTGMKVTSELALIERLAGSIEVPDHLKGVDIEEAIKQGKEQYFRDKYKRKKP